MTNMHIQRSLISFFLGFTEEITRERAVINQSEKKEKKGNKNCGSDSRISMKNVYRGCSACQLSYFFSFVEYEGILPSYYFSHNSFGV